MPHKRTTPQHADPMEALSAGMAKILRQGKQTRKTMNSVIDSVNNVNLLIKDNTEKITTLEGNVEAISTEITQARLTANDAVSTAEGASKKVDEIGDFLSTFLTENCDAHIRHEVFKTEMLLKLVRGLTGHSQTLRS